MKIPLGMISKPPEISNPDDIDINIADLPYNVSWTIHDDTTLTGQYYIYINEILNKTGTWQNNTPVSYEFNNFQIGIYNFTIQVSDGINLPVSDTVIVTISEGTTTTTTETSTDTSITTDTSTTHGGNLGVAIGISGGAVLIIGVVVVVILKNIKKNNIRNIQF